MPRDLGGVPQKTTDVRLSHPSKAPSSISATIDGIVIEDSELQFEKACFPIETNAVGKISESSFAQFANALSPMDEMDGGNSTVASEGQLAAMPGVSLLIPLEKRMYSRDLLLAKLYPHCPILSGMMTAKVL